jgi:hypothetical protein
LSPAETTNSTGKTRQAEKASTIPAEPMVARNDLVSPPVVDSSAPLVSLCRYSDVGSLGELHIGADREFDRAAP